MKSIKNFHFISFLRYIYVTLIVLGLMFQAISSAQAGDNHFLIANASNSPTAITLNQMDANYSDQQTNMFISGLAVGLTLVTIWALRRLNEKSMVEIPLDEKRERQ